LGLAARLAFSDGISTGATVFWGGDLAARRGRTARVVVFFPDDMGAGFVFITADPCFVALP
jgi:cysteine synthase